MASFSQKIPNKYGINSYQNTKNTYDWIVKALNEEEIQDIKIKTEFSFRISEISCSCESIEEFIENAYGQDNYSFVNMIFHVRCRDTYLCYISVHSDSEVYISAETKIILEKIVNSLKKTSLGEEKVDKPSSVTYIEHQDNSVTVNGNSNVIANNHSKIVDRQEKVESKINKWFQGICQGILANLMWWILGIAAVIILAWVTSKGYINR